MAITDILEHQEPSTEAELVEIITLNLVERDEGLQIFQEVRSHGRARTDLILWDGEFLVGIEAKLSDWGRVIGQAVLNRQCYDRSYLAMWASAVTDSVLSEASRFGIGVMVLNALGLEIVLDAQHQEPIPELREKLITALEATSR